MKKNESNAYFSNDPCVHRLDVDSEKIQSQKLNNPFYYKPSEIAQLAINELKKELINPSHWEHNFGLTGNEETYANGKMFGVLVVQNDANELGYLSAFSGKLGGKTQIEGFVPPIFDMRVEGGFYRIGEEELNAMNREIEERSQSSSLTQKMEAKRALIKENEQIIKDAKEFYKLAKLERNHRRIELSATLNPDDLATAMLELEQQSKNHHFRYKDIVRKCTAMEEALEQEIQEEQGVIDQLKELRRNKSAALQDRLFESYTILDSNLVPRSLKDIFLSSNPPIPPAGAGDCAAPKLFQYAFQKGYRPIAVAEFWWGKAPKTEIRKHELIYPSCRGKCEPILRHMLRAIELESEPSVEREKPELEIVFEDDYMCIVSKPAEFLSVPGKIQQESVYSRMRERYPNATGPLLVHRLDMSTSGILLVAKSMEIYHHLQAQFIKKTIKKRYVALLDGLVTEASGEINLPLRVDHYDRPRQMVCFDEGKPAKTQWELVEQKQGKSRVYFYPITGRTHQLRVHAAHHLGLNMPIVGDDIYGIATDRLYLHAETIEFTHPVSRERMYISTKCPF